MSNSAGGDSQVDTDYLHETTEGKKVGFIEVDEDDDLEGVGMVAVDEEGNELRGPSQKGNGRYVLVFQPEGVEYE